MYDSQDRTAKRKSKLPLCLDTPNPYLTSLQMFDISGGYGGYCWSRADVNPHFYRENRRVEGGQKDGWSRHNYTNSLLILHGVHSEGDMRHNFPF